MAGNRYYEGPVCDHFDGTHFFNPDGELPGTTLDALRWQFGGGRSVWPAEVENEGGRCRRRVKWYRISGQEAKPSRT